ncbi:MAG TPA: ester cyclase [Kouleothrix sp.]|mgnify:CR=1 FL=1|uniref:ester cyclase n=1 Tax=Kouleothrix sp. TaxID=2779161 RepID=UPI002C39CF4E|nr:ester cyclase [Kouleothrix sp.]
MEANKALVRHWLDLWNQHALDQLAGLVAPNYVHHTSAGDHVDFSSFQQGFAAVLHAYPDMHYTISHLFAEGDLTAVYVNATGTQQGSFFGIAPNGSRSSFTGIYHCRIQNGQIVEDWDIFDLLTALFRLGATIQAGASS